MDLGSPTELRAPDGAVQRLSEVTQTQFPNLATARDFTAQEIRRVVRAFAGREAQTGVSTCVFGSWARQELTTESDDDWAVLVDHRFDPYEAAVASEMIAAQEQLGREDRRPGKQGVFGVPFAVPDLVSNIGLDSDTNTNLTRRMLLLLESRELHGAVREDAIDQILDRYLNEGVKDFRPPRFLLNDVIRYWRTICVDFEGKSAGSCDDPKWASRNAKLRTSRKLLFAGGLVPLLLCVLFPRDQMHGFLAQWFGATPLDRLSSAFLFVGAPDVGARAISAYDRWIGLMADDQARAELRTIRYDTRDDSPVFTEIRELGREFEDALSSLLFSSRLGAVTRSYGIF